MDDQLAADPARAAVARLRASGVRLVRVIHPDLFGRARSKQFPVEDLHHLIDGIGYCEASLVESLHGEPLMGGGFPGDLGFPDVRALPDVSTLRVVPWEPDTAWVLATVHDDDGPSPLCARGVLQRAVARLAGHGLTAIAAAEPEFYLLRGDGSTWDVHSGRAGMAYTAGERADPGGAFGRIHRGLLDLGIGITAGNREFSPGQFELNLRHTDALAAADGVFLLKEAVKDMASREALLATFMPKPREDVEGSSMHVHVSLWRGAENAFAGADGLTPLCRAFTAGVLVHAPALTALASPTVNSYKRLVPGGMAPVAAGLSGDDRGAYVRIPAERGRGARIEVRGGDAAAQPHLLMAAIIHAGVDGIERGLAVPDEPVPLPASLEEAVAALEADEAMVAALDPHLVRIVAALQREQLSRFRRAVTDWEWREYGFHA